MDVIIAARLSQLKAGAGQSGIESQDIDAREWAEEEGHSVIATVADHASGTKPMHKRPNLGAWVTDPGLMDRYQGIVAAKQDRLSRAAWRDEGDLRRWAEDNGKVSDLVGEVYLFKSGRHYKIGKTKDTVRRGSEIRIQLPEKLSLIHSIKTDDPSGIESYWHNRFESKRMEGEWFDLNSADIRAFKRWRRIY